MGTQLLPDKTRHREKQVRDGLHLALNDRLSCCLITHYSPNYGSIIFSNVNHTCSRITSGWKLYWSSKPVPQESGHRGVEIVCCIEKSNMFGMKGVKVLGIVIAFDGRRASV